METDKQPIQIPLKDTKEMTCKCGSVVFLPGFGLRKISALISPTGREEISPMQVFYCVKCFEKFAPEESSSIVT
jgi:hypothetical protein